METKQTIIWTFCACFAAIFVLGGLWFIYTFDFYFTDRIFIVVISWAFPVKTTSYCLDRLKYA